MNQYKLISICIGTRKPCLRLNRLAPGFSLTTHFPQICMFARKGLMHLPTVRYCVLYGTAYLRYG